MSNGHNSAELRLPVGAEGADLVRAFVREASLADGVASPVASLIASDVEETWRALCKAGASEDSATIILSCSRGELRARILLKGHSRFSAIVASLKDRLPRDVGLAFRERGIDGWEIALHRSLEAAPEDVGHTEEPATPATDSVQIDLPNARDSAAIARCFLAVYGHNYVHREVFSPHRYWRKVESGECIPVIARDANGEAVGHVALEREPGAPIAERGEAVVLPSYRGRHLLERMTERLTQEAIRIGLTGIYAQPVTTHTFSQRNDERAGMPVCAMLLGAAPETSHSRDLPVPTAGQRQSFLLTFRFLKQPAPREVFAPPEYRDVISRIYGHLGVGATFRDGATPAEARSTTSVMVDARGYGKIRFERIGSNAGVELSQAVSDVASLGARAVQLSAHTDDPRLSLLCDHARRLGFFFCGLAPVFSEGRDILLLQRLSEPLDISELQLFTDKARELAAFIEQDRRLVSGLQ